MTRWMSALAAVGTFAALTSASFAAEFNTVVETVLLQQKEVKELDAERQGQMVACVKEVLADLPASKQAYVAEAADFDQMEDRFGEVVLANQAEFKQAITKKCGGIALQKS